jgi:hypothetical protein
LFAEKAQAPGGRLIGRLSRALLLGNGETTMTILDPKAQRLLRESEETALTLIEDRGLENARAWAQHCAMRDRSGFWRAVILAIDATNPSKAVRAIMGD